jgi:hypothetical protein
MWYVGGVSETLGFWSVNSFLSNCSSVGGVCSFDVGIFVGPAVIVLCVLSAVMLRFGDGCSDTGSSGKGRVLCVPVERVPGRSSPLPSGGLCMGFRVSVYSDSRVVLGRGGVVSFCLSMVRSVYVGSGSLWFSIVRPCVCGSVRELVVSDILVRDNVA